MDKSKYLRLGAEELYNHLISDVLADPTEGLLLLGELAEQERYRLDYEFRILVETALALVLALTTDQYRSIQIAAGVIERAKALKMWRVVSYNWNTLGNAYVIVGLYDKGLECYENLILNEKENGGGEMTATAYTNIGLLYRDLGDSDKAYRYFRLAIDHLDDSDSFRYTMKSVFYHSALIIELCKRGSIEEAERALAYVERMDMSGVNNYSLCILHEAKMFYYFYSSRFEEARASYLRAVVYADEQKDVDGRVKLLASYAQLCSEFDLPFSLYERDLLEIENIPEPQTLSETLKIYSILRNQYRSSGEALCLGDVTEKYIALLEKNNSHIYSRQLLSLQVVNDMIDAKANIHSIASKNTELELIAEEAIRHKNALQEAYDRIELISDIGKKLTSSLNMLQIIDIIFRNLRANIPMEAFYLVVADPVERKLRSVAYYERDELQPPFEVDFDSPTSIIAECYREKRVIMTSDLLQDRRYRDRKLVTVGDGEMKSAVFLPIEIDDQVIGVCSLQNKARAIYTPGHLEFLGELMPYIAIALNNTAHSLSLEREIQSHRETQAKLEAVNRRLEQLSSLDGLTRISNRRDFESKILGLIQEAEISGEPISILMIDIDNFKLYNDTYGHLEGDEALKSIADVIRGNLDRFDGLSARFGGEEFIGACKGLDYEAICVLSERIRSDVYDLGIPNIEAPLRHLTISVGAAVSDAAEVQLKSHLMRVADSSLYQAKNAGKNRVVVVMADDVPDEQSRL